MRTPSADHDFRNHRAARFARFILFAVYVMFELKHSDLPLRIDIRPDGAPARVNRFLKGVFNFCMKRFYLPV